MSDATENETTQQSQQTVKSRGAAQCYFRPETEEFVFIAGSEMGAFEAHWREMMTTVDAFHQAQESYSTRIEQYAQAAVKPVLPKAALEKHAVAVDESELALEKTREALKKKLGVLGNRGASYDEVVELIPIGQGSKKKGGGKAPRYAYVKKGYFSKTEEGRKLHSVSLKGSDKDGAANSVYSRDKHGNVRIDGQKLLNQLTKFQSPKLKLDLNKALKLIGSDFDLNTLNKDYTLFDWAESWNNSLLYAREVNANVDVAAGAQFMRLVSNVAMNADFDPSKNRGTFKAEAKTSLSVASGFVSGTYYAPDRMGWTLAVQGDDGNTFDLGKLRVCVEAQLAGFIGASAQIEAQLQVIADSDQQRIAGQPDSRLPRFRERRTTGRQFHQAMEASEEGVQASGEAFAGARLDGSLKGSIQWLKPNPAPEPSAGALPAVLKSSGQFTSFCTFGSSIAGLVGVGGGGKLRCTFINGKFCFQIAASLCWGAGAKGSFLAEVDVATIAEFGAWLIYQLYSLDYAFFDVIEEKAFVAYNQYCVLQMADMKKELYGLYAGAVNGGSSLSAKFEKFLNDILAVGVDGISASNARNQIAQNVLDFKEDLLLHTPEAKGILLYLLTRHGKMDHFDVWNRSLSGDIYASRKDAVVCILTSIQTVCEWNEVMCRIDENGLKTSTADDLFAEVAAAEAHLIRFLQEGYNRDLDMLEAKQRIRAVYARLKKKSTLGYALALNDTAAYRFGHNDNPSFPHRCAFGPCDAMLA